MSEIGGWVVKHLGKLRRPRQNAQRQKHGCGSSKNLMVVSNGRSILKICLGFTMSSRGSIIKCGEMTSMGRKLTRTNSATFNQQAFMHHVGGSISVTTPSGATREMATLGCPEGCRMLPSQMFFQSKQFRDEGFLKLSCGSGEG